HVETNGPVWPADFNEFRAQSRLFAGFATYQVSSGNLLGMGEPEQLSIVPVEKGLFPLLGAAPVAGRTIAADDPPNVTVVSSAVAQARFGGASAAVGRMLNLDGRSFTVIGVMPAEFQFPYRGSGIDLWIPWEMPPVVRGRLEGVIARLRPGVGLEA